MWTMNFHMFKLVLEKAEEPEIKSQTSAGSLKKQESSRKTSISALLTMSKPLTVWITINCGDLFSGLCHFWDYLWCIIVFYYNRNTCFQTFQIPEKWHERKPDKQNQHGDGKVTKEQSFLLKAQPLSWINTESTKFRLYLQCLLTSPWFPPL